jgi:sugar-specific transcriptional regulator TrmB
MNEQSKELPATLHALGFSTKEATVYVALLELGHGTVTEIARKAGINRTTGYDVLDSLANKGIVNVTGKEPKQEYAAEPPEAVISYLKREAEAARERIKKAEALIPQLKSVHATQNRPRIKFYEGTDGLTQVYEDTLTSREPIRAYASVEDVHTGIPNYFPEYFKRRAAKHIPIRAIFPKTPAALARQAGAVAHQHVVLVDVILF